MIIAGIDEAGYGPMLGPLVVSASVFRVPDGADANLWKQLSPLVVRKSVDGRIAVNDSKKIYKRRKGLQALEEGLLPFLSARHDGTPRDLRELLRQVARRGKASRNTIPAQMEPRGRVANALLKVQPRAREARTTPRLARREIGFKSGTLYRRAE